MKRNIIFTVSTFVLLAILYFVSESLFFRWDLTSEKRYSVSENTKKLMAQLDGNVDVSIYLEGDLNAGFLRLRKSTKEMLDEFQAYSKAGFKYEFINPSLAKDDEEREKNYQELEKRGLHLMLDNEDKDEDGQSITRIVCPWAEIKYNGKTQAVCLVKDVAGKSRDENMNYSIENLEYALTDALRKLNTKKVEKIAFIEGHGELPEVLTYDISNELANYYEVDRGQIGNDASCLDEFKCIIIAGPTQKFSEKDKFVIDNYIMNGGKVLWLVDGVRISLDSLRNHSETIGIANELNLEDQLFTYGVRINPVLVQDAQCSLIPVNTARAGDPAKWSPKPWYYSPLLLTSPVHPTTKNLTPVKSEFASAVDFVGNDKSMKRDYLLLTSTGSRIQQTPSIVSMNIINVEKNGNYFNTGNVPVAVSIEGHFKSNFAHRMVPEGVFFDKMRLNQSYNTRMIVIADADIIANEVKGSGNNISVTNLGYDSYMKQQFGNKDFIMNCVNYLTDSEGWMELRTRELVLRLLNKPAIIGQRRFWQTANVLLPLIMLGAFGCIYYFYRKRRYTK